MPGLLRSAALPFATRPRALASACRRGLRRLHRNASVTTCSGARSTHGRPRLGPLTRRNSTSRRRHWASSGSEGEPHRARRRSVHWDRPWRPSRGGAPAGRVGGAPPRVDRRGRSRAGLARRQCAGPAGARPRRLRSHLAVYRPRTRIGTFFSTSSSTFSNLQISRMPLSRSDGSRPLHVGTRFRLSAKSFRWKILQ